MKLEQQKRLVSLVREAFVGAAEVSSKQKKGYQNDHELPGPLGMQPRSARLDSNNQNIAEELSDRLRDNKISSLQTYFCGQSRDI